MTSPGTRLLFVSGIGLIGFLPGQGLQLSTANVDPVAFHNHAVGYGGTSILPVGPLTFPAQIGSLFHWAMIDYTSAGNDLSVRSRGQASWSSSTSMSTTSDLVTRVSMPAPARIDIQIQNALSYTQIGTTSTPTSLLLGVDLGADGSDEFSSAVFQPTTQPTTQSSLTTYCDASGSLVRWHHALFVDSTSGGGLTVDNTLTLQFDNPTQEATYGPACAGALGCQRGSGTYDRVFVASLPGDTTFAWLMGGTQQWNVQFQGFGCPLLVEPQFILAVPLFDGPNGRKWVDFAAPFPPVPGLTFYAQGIAVSSNTFIGTNGVRIQT